MSNWSLAVFTMGIPRGGRGWLDTATVPPRGRSDQSRGGDFLLAIGGDFLMATDTGHLKAAIAFAEYARRSVVWALGDSTGDRHADVLRAMLADGPVSWKDAKQSLGLRTGADMAETVAILTDAGLAELTTEPPTNGIGRRRQVISAKGARGAKGASGVRPNER
jgi:hypothetical protein